MPFICFSDIKKPVQLFLVYNSGPLTTVGNEVKILCMSFQHFHSFWNDFLVFDQSKYNDQRTIF